MSHYRAACEPDMRITQWSATGKKLHPWRGPRRRLRVVAEADLLWHTVRAGCPFRRTTLRAPKTPDWADR